MKSEQTLESKNENKYKKREKKEARGAERDLPKCAENTIRSKIEDKLTEEKLKYKESAANPNTPWAPSGPERIEFACGKVPLWTHRDGWMRRSGRLVFSQGALLKVFPKTEKISLGNVNVDERIGVTKMCNTFHA